MGVATVDMVLRAEVVVAPLVAETEVLPPALLPQPKTMLLICHVAVVEENPAHTKPVTALALAPENWERGMLMVWVLPVNPVIETYLEVYVVAEQLVLVWISRVAEPPAGPFIWKLTELYPLVLAAWQGKVS